MTEQMIKGEIEYKLSTPIKYSHKGKDEESVSMILSSPSMKNSMFAAPIKQIFMRTLQEAAERRLKSLTEEDKDKAIELAKESKKAESTEEDEKIPKITGPDILGLLASSGSDYQKALDLFMKLICNNTCMINGDEPLTKYRAELIKFQDAENMMGVYIENFLSPS